ncbi:MAG: helix-turn-helix domain-containing protein [Mariniblastus sp.]
MSVRLWICSGYGWSAKSRPCLIAARSTDKSVTEIALDLGFESPSSFIHAFGKFFGESPWQFRKSQT